jgi:hypothetical protein
MRWFFFQRGARRNRRVAPGDRLMLLALAVITVFALIALAALFDSETFGPILPLVASLVALVIRHYFSRRDRKR